MEEFTDLLGDRLNNIDMIVEKIIFHVEDVKDIEKLVFQDHLQPFGLILYVDCPTNQSRHTEFDQN